MNIEQWRPVEGYAGYYEVSDRGRVRSVPRAHCPGRVLAPILKGTGYLVVTLCRGGVRVQAFVHHLVLQAFAGPRPAAMEGCHGRGGPLDNRWPENLRWDTKASNQRDRVIDGTASRGERHPNAKLTDAVAGDIRRRVAAGETRTALAREYGISISTAGRIASGQTWKEIAA